MPSSPLDMYENVWLVDFEFGSGVSGHDAPDPRCMVAREYHSGKTIRLWLDGVSAPPCPITLDDRSLYVVFYAPAETSCHVSLGWPLPRRVLDLNAELRWFLNGRKHPIDHQLKEKRIGRHSLLAALYYFGFHKYAIEASEKTSMRELAMRGGPYTSQEKRALLAYNETDVVAMKKLLPIMLPWIELGPALLRGRYMAAAGVVQHNGVPVDRELVERLKANWDAIIDQLILESRGEMDVVKRRDVDREKLEVWLTKHKIPAWPHTPCGALATDSDTLQDMDRIYPFVMQLKEFLHAVRRTRLFHNLGVGSDGFNRFLLSPFSSKTGRNQPSSSRAVFGPATWVRSIIQPPPGQAIRYCDWSGQEYGLAGYFSNDQRMIEDYRAGQPYLGFAKRIGLAPPDATKKTHPALRDQLKVAAGLGVLYGAGPETVSHAGNMTLAEARRVLQLHRLTYPNFWNWRQSVIDHANLHGELRTVFGWRWLVSEEDTSRSISNFPCQGNGADMMRIALALAVERGIRVCCPVHDALLVQGPVDGIDEVEQVTRECMREASAAVIGNGELRIGVEQCVTHPGHYSDARGAALFERIKGLLETVVSRRCPQQSPDNCCLT